MVVNDLIIYNLLKLFKYYVFSVNPVFGVWRGRVFGLFLGMERVGQVLGKYVMISDSKPF